MPRRKCCVADLLCDIPGQRDPNRKACPVEKLKAILVAIFEKAGDAHHFAYSGVQEDHDWSIWYADFLRNPLSQALGREFTRAELVTCLLAAEDERLALFGADHPWHAHFAEHFLTRYAPAEPESATTLSLYYYPECPFCQRVLHAIRETQAEVELRYVWDVPQNRSDLQAARGRTTVPVLRIQDGKGSDRWMPESLDIVRYLKDRAKAGKAAHS